MRRRLGDAGIRLAVFGVFALAWQVAALRSDSLLIPTFTETLSRFGDITLGSGELWGALRESNVAVAIGYPLAVVTALPVGFAAARWRTLGSFLNPYFMLLLAIPIAPLTPLIIIALGIDLTARVFVVVLFSWVFIALNARAGVRSVDKELIEMSRSFLATERQIWRKVLLPGALPSVMTGLRIGLARAIAGMVIVELLMVPAGIGGLLQQFRSAFDAGGVFAVVAGVILESVLLLALMRTLETRVARRMGSA